MLQVNRLQLALLVLSIAVIGCANPADNAPASPTVAIPGPTAIPNLPAAAAPTATASTPAIHIEQIQPKLDALVTASIRANGGSACSLAVVYPESAGVLKTAFFNYGTLSKDSKTQVDSTTEYEIGSLTKLFASDLLAKFVQGGQMNLDDPLQKYLPRSIHVPTYDGKMITLVELATHTSGLPRDPPGIKIAAREALTDDQELQILNTYKLTRAPGAMWLYSNYANSLLGIAEQGVGRDTFENQVVTQVAGPLGMQDTRTLLSSQEQAHLAQGYGTDGAKAPSTGTTGGHLAAGGLRSNARDMALYLAANILPDQTPLAPILQMTQQQYGLGSTPNFVMGLGWMILKPGTAKEEFGKDGGTAGYNSFIGFSRATNTGVVILCNGHPVKDLSPKVNALLGAAAAPTDDTQ